MSEPIRTGIQPLDAEEFRSLGHKMVDFLADYFKNVEYCPVRSSVKPGYLQQLLPTSAPEEAESFDKVMADVQAKILPGVTHWQSPNFFAYYPANTSTAGLLGELLSGGLNTIGFNWMSCPAATELEAIVLNWLGKILQLPEAFLFPGRGGGVIQGTSSEAALVTLLAARTRFMTKKVTSQAHVSPSRTPVLEKLVVYSSDQAHSMVLKASRISGIHADNIRILPTRLDDSYALSPAVLRTAIVRDIEAGLIPFYLCATVGTTSSAAMDPLSELGMLARKYSMWFHVDAAYAGSACICPEYQNLLGGVDKADSFSMNAHKWLLTTFDCCCLWVQDSQALVAALSTNPEFLRNKASEESLVIDYKDWQIPLGRRFRALKLWMVLRLHGVSNLRDYIRNHVKLAEHFENLVHGDPRFQMVVPRAVSLVCFRLKPLSGDPDNGYGLNSRLLEAVNNKGSCFLTHTVLSGVYTLRMAVGSPLTQQRHVDAAWKALTAEADSVYAARALSVTNNIQVKTAPKELQPAVTLSPV